MKAIASNMGRVSTLFTLFCGLVGGAFVQAGEPVTKAIAWEEFRERCIHPEQFDVQRAPQNIKLQCSDRRLTWVAVKPGKMELPTEHHVKVGIFSDKFFVESAVKPMDSAVRPASCNRYKEVEQVFTVERSVSCEEVAAVKGDVGDFCSSLLERAKGTQPKLVEQRDTLRVMDTCSGSAITQGQFVDLL